MGDWARAAEHNSEKAGSLCRNTESAKQKFAHFQTNSSSAHRFKWVIVVMPYITVRNTLTATHQQSLIESWTYIDYQGTYKSSNPLGSTLGTSLERELGAFCDHDASTYHPYIPRDTCTYWTAKPPHVVFNFLEGLGYKVVAAITVNQTAVWTLHKQE